MTTAMYILAGRTPVRSYDPFEWSHWFERADRTVARDEIGDVVVSTVFIGLDHNLSPDGPPLLFETLVSGGVHDGFGARAATWERAEDAHRQAVAMVRESAPDAMPEEGAERAPLNHSPLVETVAASVHQAWMDENAKHGITTRVSSVTGEEQMVPYAQLSDPIKEYDRAMVRTVFVALHEAGYKLAKREEEPNQ